MKNFSLLILLNVVTCYSFASFEPGHSKDPLASQVMIPLFNTGKQISVEEFLNLTPKSYKLSTNKKLGLKERVCLSLGKKQFRKMINKDGTINMNKMKRGGFWGGFKWHWGGFAMALVFNILAPVLALLANDERKWDRFWTALHTAIYIWLLFGALVLLVAGP